MQDVPVRIGEIIDGKYRVEGVLGQGAIGIVLRARHVLLDHPFAIKVLFTGGPTTSLHEARFTREARVSAKLRTEHAIRVHDTGVLESGEPYIAMDFLDGKDLAALLKTYGALPVEEAVTYVLQACEVVAEAHVSGVVHRDLKPANLFLTTGVADTPTIKVLDFGVSKLRGDGQRLTTTGQTLGSPLYMSPEPAPPASASVPARTSVAGTREVTGRGRPRVGIAIAALVAAAMLVGSLVLRSKPVAGPIAIPVQAPPPPTEPAVEASTAPGPSIPSTAVLLAPPAAAPSATARPRRAAYSPPVQPPRAQPQPALPPGGSRQ